MKKNLLLLLKKEKAYEFKKNFQKRGGASPLNSDSKGLCLRHDNTLNIGENTPEVGEEESKCYADICHPEAKPKDLLRFFAARICSSLCSHNCVLSHKGRGKDTDRKAAFTLAEVLITLGIIGVVAAMTIPTLVANYKTKALASGFKKSYSMLMQAVINVQNDYWGGFGYTEGDLRETNFYTALWKNFKLIKHSEYGGAKNVFRVLKYTDEKGKFLIKDYAGNVMDTYPGCPQLPTHILADGSAVGGVYNCSSNWLIFDVNGSGGPNALGHDIFYFGFDSNTRKLLPLGEKSYSYWNFANHDAYCSKNSTDGYNGVGYWALRDICPDDETKGYWECLP